MSMIQDSTFKEEVRTAHLDEAHVGDIKGAWGTISHGDTAVRKTWFARLLILIPVLIVNQEMVARLGAITRVGHARLIFERFGRFWGAFSVIDLFILNFLTIVTELIGFSLALNYGSVAFLVNQSMIY